MDQSSLENKSTQSEKNKSQNPHQPDFEQIARNLAGEHKISHRLGKKPWLTVLLESYTGLLAASYRHFRTTSESDLALSYAAEWILDNYFVIRQALRQIGEDLPSGYYRQLPKLVDGPLAGYPRVYYLARQIILSSRANLNMDDIVRFVQAFQSQVPLTMGEIWALPIMLRFVVVESLVLASGRITSTWKGDDHPLPLVDLSTQISDDEVIGAAIVSLRTLAVQDWKEFFESLSLVDRILSEDPAGVYANMDFQTRDKYRKVVEELAQSSINHKPHSQDAGSQELEVAKTAVQLAKASLEETGIAPEQITGNSNEETTNYQGNREMGFIAPRQAHVGYFLVDRGHSNLEDSIGTRPGLYKKIVRWIRSRPTALYLGCISLLSMLIWIPLVWYAWNVGATPLQISVAGLLLVLPAVTIATGLTNWLITKSIRPRQLSKIDFENGIPEKCATMVIIPTLLSDLEDIETLVHQLRLHYLRNLDENIFFGLLTDFKDAPQKDMPDDAHLLAATQEGINELNRAYASKSVSRFYLFHRERHWNPREERWMGWERKRGKIHDFNQLLLNGENNFFTVKIGDLQNLPEIKYVITLDADTLLPMDSARRLIGTIAHPLNQAGFDPDTGAIVAGYTILQPRTEIHPVSANRSPFTRVFSGDTGLDLYTLAVSDVYQDLFGEGIYVGKGIYDVKAFERSLQGVAPENAILSHDLFEGVHGRTSLVTDIVLIEHYPPNYFVQVQRTHRWVRGDWQLLPWLFPKVPSTSGERIPNRLSIIDRWKIVDNLRRSLVPPALLLLIILGWLWLPAAPVWMLVSLVALGTSFITGLFDTTILLIRRETLGRALYSLRDSALRWSMAVAYLPYEGLLMVDAITSTFYRMVVSKKHLLRWTTSTQTRYLFSYNLSDRLIRRELLFALAFTASLALLIWLLNPAELLIAIPLLLAWLISPELAFFISQPIRQKPSQITMQQHRRLRSLARLTWLYFERFVGPKDHWLAPDHYQESPLGTVAHRTSPTNIGLALLSTLAAFDLGYVGMLDLVARLRSILDNMSGLERYRGHFLNWYDTRTLDPLPPRYVSTVDSGNLAACLLVLGVGCRQMQAQSVLRWETWVGLIDLINLLQTLVKELEETDAREVAIDLQEYLERTVQTVLGLKEKPNAWPSLFEQVSGEIMPEIERQLLDLVENFGQVMEPAHLQQLRAFTHRLRYHRDNTIREVKMLLPWLFSMSSDVEVLFAKLSHDESVGANIKHAWKSVSDSFPATANLNEIRTIWKNSTAELTVLRDLLADPTSIENLPSDLVSQANDWIHQFVLDLDSANLAAHLLEIGYQELHILSDQFVEEMDFRFLFHQRRQVFHIGYNVTLEKHDNNFYDLLASEARIASIIGIAKGDIPQSHWLHLSRPFTRVDGTAVLLSWSATMFEYLMPLLFQRSIDGTLLHLSSLAAIQHQNDYAVKKGVPWGISESGYYRFDSNQFYQYRAFGVPGLGYKRGLGEDLVISPYASILALPFRPQLVLDNIEHLASYGMIGTYGFYEAIDFTQARIPLGEKYRIVRS